MLIDLPEHVREKTEALGEPVLVSRPSAFHMAFFLVAGVLAIALGLLLGIAFFVFADAPKLRLTRSYFDIAALVFLLGSSGIGMLVKWRRLKGTSAIAFERGLARVRGQQCEVMRWDQIKTVRRGKPAEDNEISIGSPKRLTLVGPADEEWVFNEAYTNLQDLRDVVEECTLLHMIPAAEEALRAGRTISFGDIDATQEGLYLSGSANLAWDSITEASLVKGKVVIGSRLLKRPWCQVRLYQVPNAHLLLALVERRT